MTMTMTFKFDLCSVELNQRAKYLGQKSSKVVYFKTHCPHTQSERTHTRARARPVSLPGPMVISKIMNWNENWLAQKIRSES